MTEQRTAMVSCAFAAELDAPSKAAIRTLCKSAGLAAGALGLGANVPTHYWHAAAANALKALKQAFDKPLGEIMIGAWKRYEPFLKYCDEERYPSNVISQEELLQHTIGIQCEPVVDLMLHGQTILELKFDVAVDVHITGGTLSIQNRRFMSVRLGSCSATGSISYRGKTIIERETEKLVLPGEISFGDGVPIAGQTEEVRVPVAAR